MKTTVRVTVVLPDTTAYIQRLHDDGKFFRLEEEVKTGYDAADFIRKLQNAGGKITDAHKFIDDDDLEEKTCMRFEYSAT